MASGPEELHRRLDTLREHLASPTTVDPLEQLIEGASAAAERITVEHAGMAEELLCAYEQLGAVFDVTRRIPSVRSESEVVDLFVDSLRRTYDGRDVVAIGPQSLDRRTSDKSENDSVDNWLVALIQRARSQRSVLVERAPEGVLPPGMADVMVGPVFAGDSFACAIVLIRPDHVELFRSNDMLLLESLTMFCGDLIGNHRLVRELQDMSLGVVRSLVNAVDHKDQYTSGHSVRVGYFATLLGQAIGLGTLDLQMLRWGALLHDVGKIGIRDDVLNKSGKLTDEEFGHIKEHPVSSYTIVQEVTQLAQAFDGILHHHEHYDGSGYPDGLAGEDIPLSARIIQIADVFDALTSDRAYRRAYQWPEALEILSEEAGRTVDPQLQNVFDRIVRKQVEGDERGWERMLERANRFTQLDDPDASSQARGRWEDGAEG